MSSTTTTTGSATKPKRGGRRSLPHILLLVTDQFRFDAVSPQITPNLYQFLYSNSNNTTATTTTTVAFEYAYSSTPTCTPARAALLTGKSPWAHGMLSYGAYTNCTRYATTLPRVLRDVLSYRTAAIGKNHFGPLRHVQGYQDESSIYDGLPEYKDDYDVWFAQQTATTDDDDDDGMDPLATCHLGWNDWPACPYVYEEYLHPTAWTTRRALEYLEQYFDNDDKDDKDEAQPLLLKVSYHRPHSPYDPPRRFFDAFLSPDGALARVPQLQRHVNASSWDGRYQNTTSGMPRHAWHGDPGAAAARHSRAGYLASVAFVDDGIGQILRFLQQQGGGGRTSSLYNDFLIVWTSDHGDMNGDHYLWRKGYPWEGSAHIPMAWKLPSSSSSSTSSHRTSHALVENRDVAPTIYDALGILHHVQQQLDPLLDGKSLWPILTGQQQGGVREYLDLEHGAVYNATIHWNALIGRLDDDYDENGDDGDTSIVNEHQHCERWKYIFNAHDGSEQLFCLDTDPNEYVDLAQAAPRALEAWRQRLVNQFVQQGRGPSWVKNGTLQIRPHSTVYGPNFPCQATEAAASPKTNIRQSKSL